MNKPKLGLARSFRPLPKNRERLDYARSIGLTESQVINDLLDKYGREYLEGIKAKREREFREAISSPVP